MPILTLTTDFGPKDYYSGALKGALLSAMPDLTIVDISHQVKPFDIVNAAYIVKNCYKLYPSQSLHLLCVNNHQASETDYLLACAHDQWLLAPDNGLLSLIVEEKIEQLYRIPMANMNWSNFHQRIAEIIKSFLIDSDEKEFAKTTDQYLKALSLHPVSSKDDIKGTLVHIDTYGNLVSNIHKLLFEQVADGRAFEIYLKPNLSMKHIVTSLENVPVGETFSIFNAAGYLTFGVCMGSSTELHGLTNGAIIQIQFDS